ncbi:hypothetical protein Dimus_018980 [Dionaea muscipula]
MQQYSVMARWIFSVVKELTKIPNPNSKTPLNFLLSCRAHYRTPKASPSHLYARIIKISSPSASLALVLDQWIRDGNQIRTDELRSVVRALRVRKRFKQALEVTDWMYSKRFPGLYAADRAVQLDLIGKVHGVSVAHKFFSELADNNKSNKVYGALLNCYIREGLLDESLSLFQKMKNKGFATTLAYNNIMSLYSNLKQYEKIPHLLSDMKANGVLPDVVSYGICLKSYGLRRDFESIEKLVSEMESQLLPIPIHWSIYLTAASYYLGADAADFKGKALLYIKKAEEKVEKDPLGYNKLIAIHASLGHKSEVMRLWDMKKTTTSQRRQNNSDYATIMSCLITLDEVEEVETLFEEWRKAGNLYDFRIPNMLLTGYTKRGLVGKAEKLLEKIIDEEGESPIPNSWSIIATGYVSDGNMEKALECMEKAFALLPEHEGWLPNSAVVSSILDWLSEEGDVERVEKFVDSLKKIVPMSRETLYHPLVKANIRRGNEVDGILQDMKADNIRRGNEVDGILLDMKGDNIRRGNEVDGILLDMKADNIEVDEETNKILSSSSTV